MTYWYTPACGALDGMGSEVNDVAQKETKITGKHLEGTFQREHTQR